MTNQSVQQCSSVKPMFQSENHGSTNKVTSAILVNEYPEPIYAL